jgi:Putative transcription activator
MMADMEKWSNRAWEASRPIYEAILRLPFIKELADGTLDPAIFQRYIEQDKLYLTEYSRILAHIASRLHDNDHVDAFLRFARDGVFTEKALHDRYVSDEICEMSPTCLFYTSLLKAQSMESVEIEMASVLPCFWIYNAVGKHILSIARMDGNLYADWIKTYSDPAFDAATDKAIAICDQLAEAASEEVRARMTDIFFKASRMEWCFWDAAYTPHPWVV